MSGPRSDLGGSKRLGIFGGSFDPVHIGHLIAAEMSLDHARLDRVVFVPACIPPHKQDQARAAGDDRLAMLRLATAGNDRFEVSTDELERGGVSYTVDTLSRFHATTPGTQLVLILGPDAIADLPHWREPERIVAMAEILAVERDGIDDLSALRSAEGPLERLLGRSRLDMILDSRVLMPAIGIRATDLRRDIAAGVSIRYRTPRAVEAFIRSRGLYLPPSIAGSLAKP